MNNQIYHITKAELKNYLPKETGKNKVLHIDFKKIKSRKEYAEFMEKALEFPRPIEGIYARYMDWIRDLSWFDYDRYDLFFYHFSSLASKNFEDAYEIYDEFKEIILPFWDHEVVHTVVEGKPKVFNVYIVE